MFIKLKKIARDTFILVNPVLIETMEYCESEFPNKFPNGTEIRTVGGNKFMVEHTTEEIQKKITDLKTNFTNTHE